MKKIRLRKFTKIDVLSKRFFGKQNTNLSWRQPKRPFATEVFRQHGNTSFNTAQNRSMDDHRALFGAGFAEIDEQK